MDIKIKPSALCGSLSIPPSKSVSHRMLICTAFCEGESVINDLLECEDIEAMSGALRALGAEIDGADGCYRVRGITSPSKSAVIDCKESGSALRFLIPIAAALGCETEFIGSGRLPERPITPIIEPMRDNGITFISETYPYKISGKLRPGTYRIDGSMSSQFITGLLFALSILNGDSEIVLTSPLQSKPYVDITVDCMRQFGVEVTEKENTYYVKGGQKYIPHTLSVEADMSQCAFFAVADCIGSDIKLDNLNLNSVQGDKAILDITERFKNGEPIDHIDATDIPDLVPILTVLMCFGKVPCRITGCARLRIKECDRLEAITDVLNALGGKVKAYDDMIEVTPVTELEGGTVEFYNDHRIAMAGAIAATRCKNEVIIKGAQCVAKSYPKFFDDYRMLGGNADVI
ncbi:MAG: 3-phosphoshikimate 1-carboxyvinyltransferase [Eubacterium sp.]|nr:3-phosphoshikimate 1-carboxyvinyltransferase [Eubacterium sp.]